jgi:hypothetical protein
VVEHKALVSKEGKKKKKESLIKENGYLPRIGIWLVFLQLLPFTALLEIFLQMGACTCLPSSRHKRILPGNSLLSQTQDSYDRNSV